MTGNRVRPLLGSVLAVILGVSIGLAPAYAEEPDTVVPVPELPGTDETPPPPPADTTPPPPEPAPAPVPVPEPAPVQPPANPAPAPAQNPFAGYAVHQETGFLIEPGTGNLIDGRTGLYTDLRWDAATNTVSNIFESPEEKPDPSPAASSASPTATPTPKPTATAAPSKRTAPDEIDAANASAEQGTDWSTHWLTRTVVFVLLAGAGVAYYLRLQKPSTRAGKVKSE